MKFQGIDQRHPISIKGSKQRLFARIAKGRDAFTVLELMVIIVVIALATALILPAMLSRDIDQPVAVRIKCASNLKQTALAFRIWEGDNGDHYPMSFYTNATGPLYLDSSNLFLYFQVMSTALSNPQVVVCPRDKKRSATNFTTDFNSSHVSYFVGLDAAETAPQSFLAGDSDLKTDALMKNGLLVLTTNYPVSWTKERHDGMGNVAMADGSVQQWNANALQEALKHTGLATNRLLLPP